MARGYGKRPVWFWVLVYIVSGTIVYGIIYLLFLRNDGGGGLY